MSSYHCLRLRRFLQRKYRSRSKMNTKLSSRNLHDNPSMHSMQWLRRFRCTFLRDTSYRNSKQQMQHFDCTFLQDMEMRRSNQRLRSIFPDHRAYSCQSWLNPDRYQGGMVYTWKAGRSKMNRLDMSEVPR